MSANKNRPRCFAIKNCNIDIEPGIEEFGGELIYLIKEDESKPSAFDPRFEELLLSKLNNYVFDPDKDLIVINGVIVQITKLAAMIGNNWGIFKGLVWDNRSVGRPKYVVIEMG